MAGKIDLIGKALEDAYPALVRRYQGLMDRIGILRAPLLRVTDAPSLQSPAVGHLRQRLTTFAPFANAELKALLKGGIHHPGKIEIVPALAEMAHSSEAPILDGIIGHEMGHILTGKSSFLMLPGGPEYRQMELEMDRFGTLIAGAHDAMLQARQWARGPGIEPFRASNLRTTTSLVGKGYQRLQRWLETKSYDVAQGSPGTIVSNIRGVNLSNRVELDSLVRQHNELTENWAALVKLEPSLLHQR